MNSPGFAGMGGITVGLVKPYVGLGIGLDNSSLVFSESVIARQQKVESLLIKQMFTGIVLLALKYQFLHWFFPL